MKTLIVLVVGLLSVGCATLTPEQKLKDSIVGGEYEFKDEDGNTFKVVLLENGVVDRYGNGQKAAEHKWAIANGGIHLKAPSGLISVYRINKDGSITRIAVIIDGKREDYSKKTQYTFKKIK